ncbi:hypothetical protein BANRA_05601 [Escherichia coli]|uniref:Type-F conjugative transfer system pilin assembly protein TrbC n=1 Tax=Escherichia coli TaxID=562 RepID=A0A3P5HDD0_ECOLX|nr:hypothetical protein BANRA_05601 [Escherichia coli]
MLGETRHYGIPATLRGMVNNDLKTTAEAVLSLVKDGATDGVQIDPTLFSQYGIRSVPALVVFCSQGYDIIRWKPAGRPRWKVAATGDCRQVAHDLLAGKGDSGNETYFTSDTGSGCRHGWLTATVITGPALILLTRSKDREAAVFRALSHRRVSPAITRIRTRQNTTVA